MLLKKYLCSYRVHVIYRVFREVGRGFLGEPLREVRERNDDRPPPELRCIVRNYCSYRCKIEDIFFSR